MKKYTILMIALIVGFILTACGDKDVSTSANPTIITPVQLSREWTGEGGYYALKAGTGPTNTEFIITSKNDIYFVVVSAEGETMYSLQGDDGRTIYATNAMIIDTAASEDGIWIVEGGYSEGNVIFSLLLISYDGDLVRTIELNQVHNTDSYIRSLIYTTDNLYLVCNDEVIVIDESGVLLCVIETPGLINHSALGSDGQVYLSQTTENSNDIYVVDTLSTSLLLRFSAAEGNIHDGNRDSIFILEAEDGLYALQNDGDQKPLVLWEECSISIGNLSQLIALPDGGFYCLVDRNMYTLTPADHTDANTKIKLTIASIGKGELEADESRFNSINDYYYVEVIDYTNDGFYTNEQAISRLNTDLMAGNLPDMICFANLSPYSYINKGYLINMRRYLDTDNEISEEEIAIANALNISDGIFLMSNRFNFETLSAFNFDSGNLYGWTLSEYLDIERSRPDGSETLYNTTKEQFLRQISARYLRTAIDWSNGSCDFNNAEFIEILEASNRIKENPENLDNMNFKYGSKRVAEGSLVASAAWVDSVWKLCFEESMAGCELSFVGWPSIDGSCGSDIHLNSPLGIVAASPNNDGCWEYIKFMLKDTNVNHRASLPTYLPNLEILFEKAKTDTTIPVTFTDADEDKFYNLLLAIENLAIYDETVLQIITEESTSLFNNDKTASEIAGIIQSRVSTYIAEQS